MMFRLETREAMVIDDSGTVRSVGRVFRNQYMTKVHSEKLVGPECVTSCFHREHREEI